MLSYVVQFVPTAILRPRHENEKSIQDRHPTCMCSTNHNHVPLVYARPTVLFIDLLQHYADIIPPTISKKKRESDRKGPIRKRTAPVDMRMSRSRLSVGADPREILEAQMVAKNPAMKRAASPAPPVPPLPAVAAPTQEQNAVVTSQQIHPVPPAIPPPPPLNQHATPLNIPPPPPLNIPPPPPLVAPRAVVPPPVTPPVESSSPPPRPSFREPPPEDDTAPPMPRFKSPPPEIEDAPFIPPTYEPSPSPVTVAPPTPKLDGISPVSNTPSRMSPLSDPASGAASPSEDRPGASLSRTGSNEAPRLRAARHRSSSCHVHLLAAVRTAPCGAYVYYITDQHHP